MSSEASFLVSFFTIHSLWLLSLYSKNNGCMSSHCVCLPRRKGREQKEHRVLLARSVPGPGETGEVSSGAEHTPLQIKLRLC